jgi:hypothetical protein
MATPSSQSHGPDGSPLLSVCHAVLIDIANVRAPSSLTVSEALRGMYGKKG